ncbi:acetoacetyl-CoA synthetase-like [Cynoglossus semilaevis]|uniref:acetoacetyl-CoA synthetase-like n=1 Tax=Cynoglossus semilaevis TaxID=244447 RepID=UPI000D623EE5|nr:acetoacetyl-CoA synthetase-like [Cynoglossus semilaevis]XP_024908608.1 acetoacetyl-CoA synthetase-like [Cynoglossus semilaevis]
MLGRSDGTLNPNGVRFGSSEIYNIVEAFEEVSDSLCVSQYNEDGEERVILFLKMAPSKPFSPVLVAKIKGAIRKALSARHIPCCWRPKTSVHHHARETRRLGRHVWPGNYRLKIPELHDVLNYTLVSVLTSS